MKILVTGACGFIGSTLVDRLINEGNQVVGIDNFNDYYDPKIKEKNIREAIRSNRFKLYREDILNFDSLSKIFAEEKPTKVIHLAARAGVRPSIVNPTLYAKVNVEGTVNVLTASAKNGVEQFIFGSSSSVYGNSSKMPFGEDDLCQDIVSPYGASKRSAEFFVESFWQNFDLRSIILRFFTVYGPRGRVDMAPALFTKAISEGREINKYGNGKSSRDYTYIDDIVEGIIKATESNLDFEVINLGNNNPISLNDFISKIERMTGETANVKVEDLRPGDAKATWANIEKARKLLGWLPKTSLDNGLEKYIKWLQKN